MTDTIAAIATPLALGGVAMVRISGSDAIEVADRCFAALSGRKLATLKGYQAAYGGILDGEGNELDQGIATVFRAPKSFTGEDVVELSCHGGITVTREVLRAVLAQGARMAQAGEFSKRAFCNGKMSLTQAEAVLDVIHADSVQALRSAKAQMDGALFKALSSVKEKLLSVAGHLNAWVDYPEEEIEEVSEQGLADDLNAAHTALQGLLSRFDQGRAIREGVPAAIVGRPNVGKSTLMNLLSGCEKSIVTSLAGTTRDVVEEKIVLGDAVLLLADTAGIHHTEDIVEQQGVARAKARLASASLLFVVLDGSVPPTEEDWTLLEEAKAQQVPMIVLCNKADLPFVWSDEDKAKLPADTVTLSAKAENALDAVKDAVQEKLSLTHMDLAAPMLGNERQRLCAVQACRSLEEAVETLTAGYTLDAVTVSVEEALQAVLELTGERVTDEVVGQVFSHFCVGK